MIYLPTQKMDNKSEFASLYKQSTIGELKQEQRRKNLLQIQKTKRAEIQDDLRGIQEFIQKIRKNSKKPRKRRNGLQLSEWLTQKPEDLDRWYLLPCPKGQHCMVVASNGCTEMYNKRGHFMKSFRSMLPGDGNHKNHITVLDCIFVENLKTYYVLDAVAYGNQDFVNCDTQFRFFWINSKLTEDLLTEVNERNHYSFRLLPFYDFEDEASVASCLFRYPQFEENNPELDGFLFYHKDASYTYGQTPLVGWLFPFMVPEVLQVNVHDFYMLEKPADYVDYLHYITVFDEDMRRKNRRWRGREKMQEDQISVEENPVSMIISEEKALEMEGSQISDDEHR